MIYCLWVTRAHSLAVKLMELRALEASDTADDVDASLGLRT